MTQDGHSNSLLSCTVYTTPHTLTQSLRAAVGSGVLGAMSVDVPRVTTIDLCCTAHATTGVRRLVKSVVRGLKVRIGCALLVGACVPAAECGYSVAVETLSAASPSHHNPASHQPTHAHQACQDPERAKDGMGGTYFCLNEAARKVAIFKPCDEEPLAPNNPKGYVGRNLGDPGWKPTVRVGEVRAR